jgi:2-oxoisovalerate dehydrogenase E1 component
MTKASAQVLPLPPEALLLGKLGLLRLYEKMFLLRRFELTAQDLYRKGEMPGFIHLYVGEEATAVGVCDHLASTDWITSTHRGHGHALAKGVPPKVVMAELFAKATGCSGGRGGSMHLFDPTHGLLGTNGLVPAGLPLAVGAGISAKVRGTDQVAVAFFGDGGSSHGAFHEALNFAGARNAPVIFVCENNLYATATPLSTATRNTEIASKAAAYGIPGVAVDGNDVLAVWEAAQQAVDRARSGGGPTLIEAKTYRTVGHHEGDPVVGTYRTQEEVDAWKQRCPILLFRKRLVEEWGLATEEELERLEAGIDKRVAEAAAFAKSSPDPDPSTVFDHVWGEPIHPPIPASLKPSQTVQQGWLEAVRDGIAEEMRRDPHLIYFGEGTGERGGSFAHTKGLWQEFGGERLIDTPICELGFTGAAIGASATGCRAVADLMFADFLFEAASQIVHQAAKMRYLSQGAVHVPMVLRAPMGAIKSAGAHHSGAYYPMWAHIPGLIVVVPSNPADAKGLMKTALRAQDPVLFLEPKALFATKGEVPQGEHLVPFGQAEVVRAGTDITLVSCGMLLHRCLEAAAALEEEGISSEVIDLRTIVPLDVKTIVESVTKTGHLLVVDEAWSMCGVGGEIAAAMMELAFDQLKGPVGRLHTEPVTQPFSPILEEQVVVTTAKIIDAAQSVMAGCPPIPRRARASLSASAAPSGNGQKEKIPGMPSKARLPASGDQPHAAPSHEGVPLTMPHGDLVITEARVVAWLIQVGDPVTAGQGVVEVETDKARFEVESPVDGTLVEILIDEDSMVALGEQLGTIGPAQP